MRSDAAISAIILALPTLVVRGWLLRLLRRSIGSPPSVRSAPTDDRFIPCVPLRRIPAVWPVCAGCAIDTTDDIGREWILTTP